MTLGSVDGANRWLLPRIPLYPENSTRFAHMKILLKCTPLNVTRCIAITDVTHDDLFCRP